MSDCSPKPHSVSMNTLRFRSFCEENEIGNIVTERMTNGYPSIYFTKEHFIKLIEKPNVFNVSTSCIILGNSHVEGGIFLVQPFANVTDQACAFFSGEIEGNEYIVSPEINQKHKAEICSINKSIKLKKDYINTSFDIPEGCKVLDVKNVDIPILIIKGNTFFVNSRATEKHINRLIELD